MTSEDQRGTGDTTPSGTPSGYGRSDADQPWFPFSSPSRTGSSGYPPPTGAAWGARPTRPAQTAQQQGGHPQGGPSWGARVRLRHRRPRTGRPTASRTAPRPTGSRPRPRWSSVRAGAAAASLAAATLAAVIGAGAGIGSYATLGGATAATSPISVTTVPAASSPVLDGTVSAAAAKIDPSVVTITVQAGNSGDIGSGVVLDTEGHILTNDHVVSAAAVGLRPLERDRDLPRRPDGAGHHRRHLRDERPRGDQGRRRLRPQAGGLRQVRTPIKVGQAVVAAGAPLGPVGVGHQRHRLQHRPARALRRRQRRRLPRRPDRRGDQPRQLRRPARRPQRLGASASTPRSRARARARSGSQSGNIGIGFAIPSDVAVRVAGELIANGKSVNAALGVTVGGADNGISTATGVPLQTVTADGAAAAAGLRAGRRRHQGRRLPHHDARRPHRRHPLLRARARR